MNLITAAKSLSLYKVIRSQVLGSGMGTNLEGDIIQPTDSSFLVDNDRHVADVLPLSRAGRVQSRPSTMKGQSVFLACHPTASDRTWSFMTEKQRAQGANGEIRVSDDRRQQSLTHSYFSMGTSPASIALPWQNLHSQESTQAPWGGDKSGGSTWSRRQGPPPW